MPPRRRPPRSPTRCDDAGKGGGGIPIPSLPPATRGPSMQRSSDAPFFGVAVGLRPVHYPRILDTPDPARLRIDFFEAISENYMVPGARPLRVWEDVRPHFPVVRPVVAL